jgi:hypothetical protein
MLETSLYRNFIRKKFNTKYTILPIVKGSSRSVFQLAKGQSKCTGRLPFLLSGDSRCKQTEVVSELKCLASARVVDFHSNSLVVTTYFAALHPVIDIPKIYQNYVCPSYYRPSL